MRLSNKRVGRTSKGISAMTVDDKEYEEMKRHIKNQKIQLIRLNGAIQNYRKRIQTMKTIISELNEAYSESIKEWNKERLRLSNLAQMYQQDLTEYLVKDEVMYKEIPKGVEHE